MSIATPLVTLLVATRARRREQWLSASRLKDLRQSRLRRLVRSAAGTPYYQRVFREAKLRPEDLNEAGLTRLPILEKATLHAGLESGMLALPKDRVFPVTTSGSTGEPLKVYRSVQDQAQVSALWARVLHAYGHGFFDSQVNISTGQAVARSGPVALLRTIGLLPQIRHLSSFEPVEQHIDILREHRPHTFSAYAVSLETIAESLLARGIRDVRPKVVLSAAMPLSERGRAAAREAFGVPPRDVYVTAELGTVAWECPRESDALHLNDDMQIVEVLDQHDRPVPDGEIGQVVVTQLCGLAQPLLRYRLGDLAARIPGQCRCGRGLARLTRVQGRTRHVIRTPDGRMLYGMMVSAVVKPFEEVQRWQLRQVASDALRLLVMPARSWRPEVVGEIEREMTANFGPGLRFEVQRVDDIPLAPNGKLQTIVPLVDGV